MCTQHGSTHVEVLGLVYPTTHGMVSISLEHGHSTQNLGIQAYIGIVSSVYYSELLFP